VSQVINIRNDEAVRLALQLKKALVDTDRLEISQEELELTLFAIMQGSSYGAEFVSRYRLVTAFNRQRLPVIILIAGAPFAGKTSLATLLSERLNAPSLIQSLLVYEVVRALGCSHPDFCLQHDLPSWLRPHTDCHSFLEAFQREGSMVRQGLEGDLNKCLEEVVLPFVSRSLRDAPAGQSGHHRGHARRSRPVSLSVKASMRLRTRAGHARQGQQRAALNHAAQPHFAAFSRLQRFVCGGGQVASLRKQRAVAVRIPQHF
jgi:hypothetical protein